jgi:hypothetical protein
VVAVVNGSAHGVASLADEAHVAYHSLVDLDATVAAPRRACARPSFRCPPTSSRRCRRCARPPSPR